MKKQINEIKRMQELAGLLTEENGNTNNTVFNSNEELCDFLNQNIKELIKHENIVNNWEVNDVDSLKLLVVEDGDAGDTTIIWSEEIGVMYHWLCPENELPDGGSFEWKEIEFKNTKFWTLYFNI